MTGAVDLLESWQPVPALFRASTGPLPAPWEDLLGPLRVGRVDDLVVVAQIGQSLDGRIVRRVARYRSIAQSRKGNHAAIWTKMI